MTKKELRQMIREEARQEVYRILPDMLKEVVGEVLTETKVKQKPVRKAPSTRKKVNRRSILEEIGYGEYAQDEPDIEETMHFDSRDVHSIASRAGIPVPMDGGLASKEKSAGMGNYGAMMEDEEDYQPQYQSAPDPISNAIGRAKAIFDAAEKRSNFRPGMK